MMQERKNFRSKVPENVWGSGMQRTNAFDYNRDTSLETGRYTHGPLTPLCRLLLLLDLGPTCVSQMGLKSPVLLITQHRSLLLPAFIWPSASYPLPPPQLWHLYICHVSCNWHFIYLFSGTLEILRNHFRDCCSTGKRGGDLDDVDQNSSVDI